MPFKSEKQRKWMHANEPEMAKDWEKKESLKENSAKLVKIAKALFKDLNKKFPKFDTERKNSTRDFNRVVKYLKGKMPRVPNRKVQEIAVNYHSYRASAKGHNIIPSIGRNDIKDMTKLLVSLGMKEATTTSAVPVHKTPDAFRKSTYKAIKIDDEDDSDELIGGMRDYRKKIAKLDKNESKKLSDKELKDYMLYIRKYKPGIWKHMKKNSDLKKMIRKFRLEHINESIKVRNGEVAKEGKWKVYDSHSGKTIKEVGSPRAATRLMNRLMSSGQYKEITTKWVGETVNEADDHELEMAHGQLERSMEYSQMILKKLQDGGYDELPGWVQSKLTKSMDYLQSVFNYYDGKDGLDEEKVNEDFWTLPANWSTQEAKLHLDKDIKDMSKILGKASQQVIRIMMNGVKGGRYDALDIVRGIETGPWNRTHEGERPFMKMLWRKVRNGFRRYSKDRKLRK